LIDDDDLSREVLGLIAAEAEFATISFASGEDALAHLSAAESPFAILADMQMPGVHGNELAKWLRAACGSQSVLLAMSGSPVPDEQTAGFDGFLLKPFSSQDLLAACERTPRSLAREESKNDNAILDPAVYAKFARSLPPAQLAGLYAMCLSDARKRIETMRRALVERDDDLYRRSAHAIKGGCGMVGAIELARLAAAMEREGMAAIVEGVTDEASLTEFLAASFRLERMLDRK
jgi:CheY-like chemotaxis protein